MFFYHLFNVFWNCRVADGLLRYFFNQVWIHPHVTDGLAKFNGAFDLGDIKNKGIAEIYIGWIFVDVGMVAYLKSQCHWAAA